MKTKKCAHTIVEIDYDCDLKAFEVYDDEEDNLLGTVYPDTIEDMENCQKLLEAGECPICDGWDDGLGNSCSDWK